MDVYINEERIPFLKSHGVDSIREKTPVYGLGENGPVGFGTENLCYYLHFVREFPEGFDMLKENLSEFVDFSVCLVDGNKKTKYNFCNWQKQGESGDEWVQIEKLTAISFEKVEIDE